MSDKPRLRRVRMLPRPRTALNPRIVDLLWLAHRAACGVCAIVFGWMVMRGERAWLIGAVAFGIAAGAVLMTLNARLRAQLELVLRDRLELMVRRLRGTDDEVVIRGTPAPMLPGFLIVVWFFMYAPAASAGLSVAGHLVGLLVCPLLLLLWMRGARWLFPPVLALGRDSLTTGALGRVPWSAVSHLQLLRSSIRYAPDLHSLVVTLARGLDPRPRLSWWQRYVRGAERGRVTVPLRNTTEDRLLILHLAQALQRAANPPAIARSAMRPVSRFARQDAALLAAIRRATAPPGQTSPAPRTAEIPKPAPERPPGQLWPPPSAAREDVSQEWWAQPSARPPEPLPMRQQWSLVAIMSACMITVVFGLEADFFHSQRWNQIVVYVALTPGLAASVALIARLWPRIPERSRIGSAFAILLVALMVSWSMFAAALPDLYTRIAGNPFRIEQTVTVRTLGAKCHNRLQAPLLEHGPMRDHICVPDQVALRMARDQKAVFSGRESWFGRHVSAVATVPGS